MKNLLISLKLFAVLSFLTGILYPMCITVYANQMAPYQTNGSLIENNGMTVGSELIGQKFISEKYFWSRPSAVDYNSLSSGGSNLALSSQDLFKQYNQRKLLFLGQNSNVNDQVVEVPQDLLFASGSGLDPHISVESANFQLKRVAEARQIPQDLVRNLVNQFTESRQFGILGEPRINVLLLNLALDRELK